MKPLSHIEQLARGYSVARAQLAECVTELEEQIAHLKRARMFKLRRLIEKTAKSHDELSAAIQESPGLFERPRTHLFHGVRVGFRKAKGKLSWDKADQVVKLIRRHLPEQAETLIKTTEAPLKEPLAQLTAAELKRLGVRVGEDSDEVLIKPADSDIDKLVDALLDDAGESEGAKP